MAKLTCMDYGFDCPYEVEGEVEHVIGEYQKHSNDAVSYTHLTLPTKA